MTTRQTTYIAITITAVAAILAATAFIYIGVRKKKDLAPIRDGFVLDTSKTYDNMTNAILGYNPDIVSPIVKKWQQALNKHQVMQVSVDGRFGPKTAQATYNLIGYQYVTSVEFTKYTNK